MDTQTVTRLLAGAGAGADATRPLSGNAVGERSAATPGPILFARYAYAPNSLGYCGPTDNRSLLEYASSATVDGGLREAAKAFQGAWPYLELISRGTGVPDPLDARVVEAYWLGNDLLGKIDFRLFGASLLERFRQRAGKGWGYLAEAIPIGAAPTHSFHVFGVYPWVGLLSAERRDPPMQVLDRCRIRWGQVVAVEGDSAVVLSRPLVFDGRRLALADQRLETVTRALEGVGYLPDLAPGDWVSMHWHWICDRLSRRQLANLKRHTLRQLEISNERVSHPGPATVMG